MPIFFRLTMREEDFKPGPFSLGKWSKPMCCVSLSYILYTMAIFMAPNLFPVTTTNLNYGPIGKTHIVCCKQSDKGGVECDADLWQKWGWFSVTAFCSVMFLAFMAWLLEARKWFKGPVRTVDSSMHGGM